MFFFKKLRNIKNKKIRPKKISLREIIKILELELNKEISII